MFDNVHTTHRYEISADFSYNSIRLWGGVMCTVFQNSEIGFKSLFILHPYLLIIFNIIRIAANIITITISMRIIEIEL